MSMRKRAIALEYGKNRAPVVTAKGEEEAAMAMIAQARAYGIYVTEDQAAGAIEPAAGGPGNSGRTVYRRVRDFGLGVLAARHAPGR